jgi:putative copper resistance protein D
MDNFLLLPRALAAGLSDAAFAVACGSVIATLWLRGDLERPLRDRLRRGLVLCAVAMLLALSAQAYLLTATMVGSSDLSLFRSQFEVVMTGTHAGRALFFNGGLACILLILLLVRRRRQTNIEPVWLSAVLIMLAAIRAATGHSAAEGDFTLPEFVQFLHLISIAIWSGGVIATGFIVLPGMLRAGRIEAMVEFTRRLSRTVTVALLLVVLTGVYNSYRGLGGSVAPLVGTQWGYLLDVKLVLVCVAVSMGACSRSMLRANHSLSLKQASRLTLMLRAEATVMLVILAVSAWLANSPPPDSL